MGKNRGRIDGELRNPFVVEILQKLQEKIVNNEAIFLSYYLMSYELLSDDLLCETDQK